ncbi:peptidoglycan-binding protein [Trichocoleus desertorum AS-A10]|uniref:peptidoglycan-binding domain-containing protein n=1 Tax=Trichocoleus desertorum TaxID=1481672 RepID=UPI003296FAA9
MLYTFENQPTNLATWIQNEIKLSNEIFVGAQGLSVRRVQEWLTLRGYPLTIDESYGPITAEVVGRFQEDLFLEPNGRVTQKTFDHLVEPLRETLRQRLNMSISLNSAVLEYARAHLSQHPREIGGQNRGPWVRMYMKGNEGKPWAWCAGFVTFVLSQAAESLQIDMPIPGSFSCDTLAAQAKAAGLFVSEAEARRREIPPGSLFLVRRTSTDWTHVGIVAETHELLFDTIEGNTNDEGSREGYEVCTQSRGYTGKDFILLEP